MVDSIIYPPLEKVPKRFCILKRNEWIIDHSDIIVFFVRYSYGGAHTALEYAKKKKKKIYNIASLEE